MAIPIERPVQADPPPGDLDVGLIDEPPITHDVPARPCGVDQQRGAALHPAVDRDVVDLDPAFGRQLFHIPVGESVAKVPVHRRHDHIRREPEPGEGRSRRQCSTRATMHRNSLPEPFTRQRNRPKRAE
jgi:hypothetical protein